MDASTKFNLPPWFFTQCVTTAEELIARRTPLLISNSNMSDTQVQHGGMDRDVYQIESALYEVLGSVVQKHPSLLQRTQENFRHKNSNVHFIYNALLLRFPNPNYQNGGSQFLESVVQHFARSSGADLITLKIDTIKDIVEDCIQSTNNIADVDVDDDIKKIFRDIVPFEVSMEDVDALFGDLRDESHENFAPDGISDENNEDIASNNASKTHEPGIPSSTLCQAILASPLAKTTKDQRHNSPLVVHLRDVHNISYSYNGNILRCLLAASRQRTIYTRNVIFVGTDWRSYYTDYPGSDEALLSTLGSKALKKVVLLVPLNCESQRLLIREHEERESSSSTAEYKKANVKRLQKALRDRCASDQIPELLRTRADWSFLYGTEAEDMFSNASLPAKEVEEIVCEIGHDFSISNIANAVARIAYRQALLRAWDAKRNVIGSSDIDDRLSHFPQRVQDVARALDRDEYSYRYEKEFLELLVDRHEIEAGWSDIALDPEIVDTFKQIIAQPGTSSTFRPPYGILKKSQIGGALLYGPPGTWKTHLARVLAFESAAVTICVSGADIESLFVGETEKAIKGLFRLAKMLAPSIIFIDEADSLLSSRSSAHYSWESSRVNQFLSEMDGLLKTNKAPFVILATNFPLHLENAVLRRVPSRIYVGLPSKDLRRKIFEINLRDEILSPDLTTDVLAELTPEFTGSDIQALCVQAALVCDSFVPNGADEGKRILNISHFERGLRRVSPTVSRESLAQIRDFAKEFDSVAYGKMKSEQSINFRESYERSREPHQAEEHTMRTTRTEQSERPPRESNTKRHHDLNDFNSRIEELPEDSDETRQENEMRASFQYDLLDPTKHQIRVISIDSSDDGDSISCKIETVSLKDWTTQYQVFRYVDERTRVKLGVDKRPEYLTKRHFTKLWSTWNGASQYDLGDQFTKDIQSHDRFNWGDYMALSYVWGDPHQTRAILIDGHSFDVTVNLHDALLHLKKSAEVRQRKLKVWIDAICINQADPKEKSIMVKRMNSIYADALCVRGWIGVPSSAIVPDIARVREMLDKGELAIQNGRGTQLESKAARLVWTVLSTLSQEPYWERLWIMQEVALACSICFWYGNSFFTPRDVILLSKVSQEIKHVSTDLIRMHGWEQFMSFRLRNLDVYARLSTMRPNLMGLLGVEGESHELDHMTTDGLSMFSIINLGQTSRASDPRDKVYGLLALLPEALSSKIQPSYDDGIDATQTYINFSRTCIEENGNLNTLCEIVPSKDPFRSIPSWAFDMREQSNRAPRTDRMADLPSNIRMGCFDADGGVCPAIMFSANSRLLSCQGVIVDTIDGLGAGLLHGMVTPVGRRIDFKLGDGPSDPSQRVINGSRQRSNPSSVSHLSVARLLMHNRKYHFSDGPSILDIPWLDSQTFDIMMDEQRADPFREDTFYWSDIGRFFSMFLYPNQDFLLGGTPLQEYFKSHSSAMAIPAQSLTESSEMIQQSMDLIQNRRLFTTDRGRIGSAPSSAQPGDKIVILIGCKMPLVLRPKGSHFLLMGSCWEEGLMDGEAVQGLKDGSVETMTITLC